MKTFNLNHFKPGPLIVFSYIHFSVVARVGLEHTNFRLQVNEEGPLNHLVTEKVFNSSIDSFK